MTDTENALANASRSPPSYLRAETFALGRQPGPVTETLDAAGQTGDPRDLRLRIEARYLEARYMEAIALARELSGKPGWETHALMRGAQIEQMRLRAMFARVGGMLFALAMGVLLLGGGRELLRPRREVLVAGLGMAAGLLVSGLYAMLAGRVLALAGIAACALLHAGLSSEYRRWPGPRGRVLITTTVVLGALGAFAAAALPVPIGVLLGRG